MTVFFKSDNVLVLYELDSQDHCIVLILDLQISKYTEKNQITLIEYYHITLLLLCDRNNY